MSQDGGSSAKTRAPFGGILRLGNGVGKIVIYETRVPAVPEQWEWRFES